jgi:hypothetical protein
MPLSEYEYELLEILHEVPRIQRLGAQRDYKCMLRFNRFVIDNLQCITPIHISPPHLEFLKPVVIAILNAMNIGA